MARHPSDLADKFMLRLPEGLRERIAARAKRHGRSMNSEIVEVLEAAFPKPSPLVNRLNDLITFVAETDFSEDPTRLKEEMFERLADIRIEVAVNEKANR